MAAQHSQNLESWFSCVPGLKVVTPATPYDVKGLMKAAIRDDNPVILCDHKKLNELTGHVPEDDYTVPIGEAAVARSGKDITIVTYAFMVQKSMEAAEQLSKSGIDVEVVDLRTTLPIDEETVLNSVAKTGRLVTVAEAYAPCSVASEIAALVMEKGFDSLKAPLRRVHPKFAPIPFAPNLENHVLPQTEDIVAEVKSALE